MYYAEQTKEQKVGAWPGTNARLFLHTMSSSEYAFVHGAAVQITKGGVWINRGFESLQPFYMFKVDSRLSELQIFTYPKILIFMDRVFCCHSLSEHFSYPKFQTPLGPRMFR